MTTLAEQLVRQDKEIEELEAELARKKKAFADLQKLVAEEFVMNSQTKVGLVLDGKKYTVSRRRNFCCNVLAHDRPRLVQALRDLGHDDMVETTVSTSKLKPWLKELISRDGADEDDGFDYDRIPPEIRGLVRTFEDVVPVIRKG